MSCTDRRYLADGLPMPYAAEDARRWLDDAVSRKEGVDSLFRTICLYGHCIGDIAVERRENVYFRDADIGDLPLDEYRGRGLMTDAVRRICAEAFETLDLLRISARVCAPTLAPGGFWRKTALGLKASCAAPSAKATKFTICASTAGCADIRL